MAFVKRSRLASSFLPHSGLFLKFHASNLIILLVQNPSSNNSGNKKRLFFFFPPLGPVLCLEKEGDDRDHPTLLTVTVRTWIGCFPLLRDHASGGGGGASDKP